jgi:hypothetical protein
MSSSGFPTKHFHAFLTYTVRSEWHDNFIVLDLIILIMSGEQYELWCSSVCNICTLLPLGPNILPSAQFSTHASSSTYIALRRCAFRLATPWRRVLKKLIFCQMVREFPAFYGTRRFITAFRSAYKWALTSAGRIQNAAHTRGPMRFVYLIFCGVH